MKVNLKFLGVLSLVFIVAVLIASVSAADLGSSKDFSIDVPSDCDFTQSNSKIKIGNFAMDMDVFENLGNNSDEVSSIMYLKDSSSGKIVVSEFVSDLKNDSEVVEDNANYTVLKSNSPDSNFLNFDFSTLMSGIGDIFSSDEGLDIENDGDSIKLSTKGLEISDAEGSGVSISDKGIEFSDDGNASDIDNVTFDEDMIGNIEDGDYTVLLENKNSDRVIVLSGNDLDSLKTMAESVSFKEK